MRTIAWDAAQPQVVGVCARTYSCVRASVSLLRLVPLPSLFPPCGAAAVFATATAASLRPCVCVFSQTKRPAAALLCTCRFVGHSSGGSRQAYSVTAAELRAALHTLNLSDDSTDAEVKRAFHAFAMAHHPDMKAAAATSSSPWSPGSSTADGSRDGDTASSSTRTDAAASATVADTTMHRGTEAYHLLRQVPFEMRQRILREGCHSGSSKGRFRGPFSDFQFTEEEYAKAQRIYRGDRSRRRQRRSDNEDRDGEDDLFDLRTEEGRRRAARFEEVKLRILGMRRRGRRDDLPPWRVPDSEDGAGASTAAFNAASSSTASSAGEQHARAGQRQGDSDKNWRSSSQHQPHKRAAGPRNPNRLGLHFFHSTVSNLKGVRDLYRSRPGFAGMDGSSFDNPSSAARVAPELAANPHLRRYILMKHRAEEKSIVDRAAKQPLMLLLALVCGAVLVLIGLRVSQTSSARARQDAGLRRRDEERGGA
ncbi:hypothetical protein ABL78_5542 [Leptomonas seymouri]|uniref:J domain-containing protein n=1 Tax=Leptomonas seymouri TaxID=5684 RepID=A0A0N1HV10_LEPSE|nr:hypothetical protein ABL78_5542 [Leptomonas seymouri]|eukprot:KPI85394.1 hypothetical protein ABL78_5542 [Leptomonas seymouri]